MPDVVPAQDASLQHIQLYEGGNVAVPGFESMTERDITYSRWLVMQALSPAVVAGTFKAGDIINTLSNTVVVPKGQSGCAVLVYPFKEWIQWAPRDSQLGILARSADPNSELAQRALRGVTRTDGKPEVTEYLNFIVLPCETAEPVIISCCRTNWKHGRNLWNMARARRIGGAQVPIYACQFKIGTQIETNRRGQQYYVWKFENDGWAKLTEYNLAKGGYDFCVKMRDRLRVDLGDKAEDEDPEDHAVPSSGATEF